MGPGGKVFAVDINAEAVARLEEQAKNEGLAKLVVDVKEAENTLFCEGCADIVFFGIDLHDFRDPAQVLANAARMLKPSGRLADLDWKNQPMDIGPPPEKRFSVEKARYLIEAAGLRIQSVQDAGPFHYLIIAIKDSL